MSGSIDLNNPLVQQVLKTLEAKGLVKLTNGKNKGKPGRQALSDGQKAKNAAANASAAEKLFESKGYKNCKAHETIRSFNKWLEVGRRVKKGENGLKIKKGSYALFHISQTSEMPKDTKAPVVH